MSNIFVSLDYIDRKISVSVRGLLTAGKSQAKSNLFLENLRKSVQNNNGVNIRITVSHSSGLTPFASTS